jgi:DNA-binding LacI/PurR family transcriptional regulator
MSSEPLLDGARQRARELGYGIEVYQAGRDQMSADRLHRLLSARGQWGLIIPPVPTSAERFPLDLRGLTAVTIGTSLQEPSMHRVSPNHFQGCVLAFERLRQKRFSRIGLLLSPEMNHRVEAKWLGAFQACQQQTPAADRVSPLLGACDDHEAVAEWLRRERPGVLLAAEVSALRCVKQLNPRLPIGWLMQQQDHRGVGYLDYRPNQLGRVAVELVVAQIHRNERGSPAIPQTVMIGSAWIEASVANP